MISKAKKKSISALWAITASKVLFHWRSLNKSSISVSDYKTIVNFFNLIAFILEDAYDIKDFYRNFFNEILFKRGP